MLTNFRPEFSPPWAAHSYYRQVPLSPLDPEAVRRLLDGLLGGDASLAPLAKVIPKSTGGSPFFVEEVVRSLVEDGTLLGEPGAYTLARPVEHLAVPPTVQAVLAARIDRLAERDRAALQTAAVIGRNFTEPVLRLVASLTTEEVAAVLGRLCAAEFLQEVAAGPQEEYRFWHPLTQEVAYGTLLRERRATLHAAVADAVIATGPDRLDERAALLATHYERAGDPLEAARWNDRAGDFALRSDLAEATRRWRAALDHLATPATDEGRRIAIQSVSRLIRYGARTGMDLAAADHLYAQGRAAAEQLGDPTQLAIITLAYASVLFFRGVVHDSIGLYRQAALFADQADDTDPGAACWSAVAMALSYRGPVRDGLDAWDKVLSACGGDASRGARLLGFSPLSPATFAYAEQLSLSGRTGEARAALDELIAGTRTRSEAEWLAWALSARARLAETAAEFEAGLEGSGEAARNAEASGNTASLVVALGSVGISEIGLGRFSEAATNLERALSLAREHQTGLFEEARLLTHLARARLGLGDGEAARATANEAVDVARRQGARVVECFALLTRARITRAGGGRPGDVDLDADLDAALLIARETGATAYEADLDAERAQSG